MKFRHIKILMSVLSISLLQACLKDKDFDNGNYQPVAGGIGSPAVISLGINVVNATNFSVVSYNNASQDTTVNFIPVELGGNSVASQDIHVTLVQVDSLVNNYNDANGTDYAIPKVTIVNPVVTIPKGSCIGYLQIKYLSSDIIGGDYAMGFAIKSIQESGYQISGNLGTGIAAIVIKNQYDGIYLATGHMTHPAYGGDFTNKQWIMVTTGANSVQFQVNTTVTFAVYINLTIKSDNSLMVTSSSVALTPYIQANNYYDPSTKTFHVDFGYSGGTRHITATAVYSSPR